jgi:N-acetyl-anhydromuramyl-L-alanine amidase AmpD
VRHPIVWNAERESLTQAYLRHHHGGPFEGTPHEDSHMVPEMVVVHWTAGPTLKSARNTFLHAKQRRSRRRDRWNLLNLSCHFLVDRDGTIVQLMETDRVGRHTIGLNHLAIGIENVGDRDNWPLTRSQLEANAALVRWLASKHPSLSHLIGHSEYREFEGTPMFKDRTSFRTGRIDPGKPFMEALRLEVADLGLEGPPED